MTLRYIFSILASLKLEYEFQSIVLNVIKEKYIKCTFI